MIKHCVGGNIEPVLFIVNEFLGLNRPLHFNKQTFTCIIVLIQDYVKM